MRSDDYERIGKTLKHLNPGKWNGNTDEEVGLVHVESGAFSEQKYAAAKQIASHRINDILGGNSKPGFLEGIFQVGAERRRAEILGHRVEQAHHITVLQRTELESLQIEFERERLPEILAAAEFIRELQMQLQVDIIDDQQRQIKAGAVLREEALNKGLTIEANQAQKLAKFTNKQTFKVERKRSKLKVKEHRKMEEVSFEFQQKTIVAENNGTIELADIAGIVRERSVQRLRKLDLELIAIKNDLKMTEEERQVEMKTLRREVDRLDKELYPNGQGGMVGQADVGDDPEGGSTPPKPGGDPSASKRKANKPPASSHSRHVN